MEENQKFNFRFFRNVDGLKMKGVKKPKVIAVVGLGHKKGIERLLNSYKEDKAFIQQEQNNDR